jgi:anti-sigma B factor antagonist
MDSGLDFSLAVEQNGRGSVVRITGELDMATAPQLRQCLADLDGAAVTLDFSGVTFMDSSGISVLAWARKRARQGGAELHVRGVRSAQMQVLEITGMANDLNIDG